MWQPGKARFLIGMKNPLPIRPATTARQRSPLRGRAARQIRDFSRAAPSLRQASGHTFSSRSHPADQFEAFKALAGDGKGPEEIAARFGCSPATVRQRLRLASVSPALLDIYRADDMALDQLMAFTVSDDHGAQQKTWAELTIAHMAGNVGIPWQWPFPWRGASTPGIDACPRRSRTCRCRRRAPAGIGAYAALAGWSQLVMLERGIRCFCVRRRSTPRPTSATLRSVHEAGSGTAGVASISSVKLSVSGPVPQVHS